MAGPTGSVIKVTTQGGLITNAYQVVTFQAYSFLSKGQSLP